MSSNSQKPTPKMCKSPKSINFQNAKPEKIQIINEYENLNTNCTVIGSNNLHLVKKPQVITSMSPVYSHPSPGYPQSPYSSPASIKSPSPQSMKPPTPQPSFPVMQIIHNSHQLLARPIQTTQQQNVIKLKPHLNILPKPSASPQPSPKPSVSPQIVIPASQPTATIMPTQPLLINQMPMLAPGVQLILRPQTKLQTQMQTATATPQGLILQPSGQQLLHLQSSRNNQPMVRVLTNGMQLGQPQVVTQVTSPTVTYTTTSNQPFVQTQNFTSQANSINAILSTPKKKPKKKKQKLDLANIMKLSGIGDEDDIQFESDTSQSESEPNSIHLHSDRHHTTHHNIITDGNLLHPQANVIQSDLNKRIGNIQISAVAQPTISAATPLVQVLNQSFQSGVNSTSFQTSQTATQAGIPLNSFIAPNITINNGLVVQRNGGFKLALGEDGRLVLQHDPTLNQDLQSQLLLQSIFGLNGLVLQPSIDQQVHSQTVQTIQQQSVQTIQQQTVQSQTIQTVQQQTVQPQTMQHSLQTIQQTIQPQIQAVQPQTVQQTVQQTIQHQTVQSQPMSTIQQHTHTQPMQIVQPQPIQTIQSHNIHQHTIQSQPVQSLQSQIQPTVQSIQSQVQSIQSQIQGQLQSLLQSQPLQAVQAQPVHSQAQSSHGTQTIHSQQAVQTQPILKVQPFQKTQPPVQTVHPQPIQTIHHPPTPHHIADNQNQPPPTSYVVNLTPEQLEQLKRNGQLTVNGQTIFMQRPNATQKAAELNNLNNENKNVKLSPKIKPVKKVNKIQTNNTIKSVLQDNVSAKNVGNAEKIINHVKETKSTLVSALQAPPKIITSQNQAQVQPQPVVQATVQAKTTSQPSAVVQPSIAVQPIQTPNQISAQKPQIQPKLLANQVMQNTTVQNHSVPENSTNPEVEHILGQLLDESNACATNTNLPNQNQIQPSQRVHTIQLTPQQQQHLKSIQLQIQTLSARLTPGDTDMHTALKLLFAEQQKILASGKLLPPDKVIYQNNQLTIINPSSLGIGAVPPKTEPPPLVQPAVTVRTTCSESSTTHQVMTSVQQSPRITVSVPLSTEHPVPQINIIHPKSTTQGPARLPVPTTTSSAAPQHIQQNKFLPSFTKAQLLEQQLNTDQNGAMKPDIHTPFRDKADACKRLIRYHCYNQPVLSEKDLDKADEIFELTAKHFIDKFSRMVDKYRYLLHKESMRQVQTSELMMLDRMFLAEEQQSLIRLRQELDETPFDLLPSSVNPQHNEATHEEYDEWACIQRELGCLPPTDEQKLLHINERTHNMGLNRPAMTNQQHLGIGQQQSLINQQLNVGQQMQRNQQQSNSTHQQTNANQQVSVRQQQSNINQQQTTVHQPQQQPSAQQQTNINQQVNSGQQQSNHQQMNVAHQQANLNLSQQQMNISQQPSSVETPVDVGQHPSVSSQSSSNLQAPKRSASSDSRLETLKKFRVDKHNKKSGESVQTTVSSVSVGFTGIQSANTLSNMQRAHNMLNTFHVHGAPSVATSVQNVHNVQSVHNNQNVHGTANSAQTSAQRNMQNLQNTQTSTNSQTQSGKHSTHHIVHNIHSTRGVHATQSVRFSTNSTQPTTQHILTSTPSVHYNTQNTHVTQQNTQNIQQFAHNTQHSIQNVQFSAQNISQNLHSSTHYTLYSAHTQVHSTQHNVHCTQQQSLNSSVHNVNSAHMQPVQSHSSQNSENDSGNNSIDEQVQSAIDSILNLQQNSNLDLDEAVSSILS